MSFCSFTSHFFWGGSTKLLRRAVTVSTTNERKGRVVEGKELDKLERQEGKGFDHEKKRDKRG